jgi:hypothetical protein
MFIGGVAGTACAALSHLFHDVETQKRLADDDFVAITQRLTLSRGQSLATVDKRTVGRPEILQKVLAVAESDSSVTA